MGGTASYLAVTYRCTPETAELLAAEAWNAGMLGSQLLDDDRVILFFHGPESVSAAAMRLPPGVVEVERRVLPEQDWLQAYRRSAMPIPVGDRWFLDPREPESSHVQVPADRILLRLPARRAFGTGGHESTRLALRMLERIPLQGRRVLDFGSGSGVLSLAAAGLGAAWCVGVERDLAAALVGSLNRALNPGTAAVLAIVAEAQTLAGRPWADVLLVNVRPENWLSSAGRLDRCLHPGAEVICSGFLNRERERLQSATRALGWRWLESMSENDWGSARMRTGAA